MSNPSRPPPPQPPHPFADPARQNNVHTRCASGSRYVPQPAKSPARDPHTRSTSPPHRTRPPASHTNARNNQGPLKDKTKSTPQVARIGKAIRPGCSMCDTCEFRNDFERPRSNMKKLKIWAVGIYAVGLTVLPILLRGGSSGRGFRAEWFINP